MLNRYLLCIVPPEEVMHKVLELEPALATIKRNPRGTTAPVHITLLLADMAAEHEGRLQEAVQHGLELMLPFELQLSGIAHFAKRTIYVDPVEKSAVLKLLIPVSEAVRSALNGRAGRLQIADHPHMTLATGLKPVQFDQAMAALAGTAFQARFTVNSVELMVRPLATGTVYQALRSYPLAAG